MDKNVDAIHLKFRDGSTFVTSRDALCCLEHTWFKRAFCGRYDEQLAPRDGAHFVVEGSTDSAVAVRVVAEFLAAQHDQQHVHAAPAVLQSALATAALVDGEDVWNLLREALHFGVRVLADAAAWRVCEVNAGHRAPIAPAFKLGADEVAAMMDLLKLLLVEASPHDKQQQQTQQQLSIGTVAMLCGFLKAAVAAECDALVSALQVISCLSSIF